MDLIWFVGRGKGSKFQRFKGSKFQRFKVSKVQRFKVSKVQRLVLRFQQHETLNMKLSHFVFLRILEPRGETFVTKQNHQINTNPVH